MIPPFRFFWSKILPISYSNYLSETEILEFLRKKIDETIVEVNRVEEYIQNELPEAVEKLVIETIEKYLAELLEKISDLQNQLDELKEYIDEQDENLRKAMDECCQEMSDRLDATNELIYDEIATLDAKIQNQIADLDSRLKDVENWYDFMKAYIDKQISLASMKWVNLLSRQYNVLTRYIRKYFNELSNITIRVISPITGREVTLQYALEEIVGFVSHGLTAWEYRMLNLTAEEYRLLYLTAEEYRLYGIWLIGQTQDVVKMYDLMGREVEQPLSSVYEVFGDGITADMGGLNISTEQYRFLSDVYGASNLDRYGSYILTNQMDSVYLNQLHLSGNSVVIDTNGQQAVNIDIVPDTDSNIVPYFSLLNADSVEKLISNIRIDVDGNSEWASGEIKVVETGRTLDDVNGMIRLAYMVISTAVDNNENPSVFRVHVDGLTSTKQVATYNS